MTGFVVCLDVGGSGAKATVVTEHGPGASARVALAVQRPAAHRVQFDPAAWWRALQQARLELPGPAAGCLGLVVTTLRQGFVLSDGSAEVGPGVLNSDRRGAPALARLRARGGLYELTGHWPAPELTLPKLMAIAGSDPEWLAAAPHVLFVHDWLLWRLTGALVTEGSYACAGGVADVAGRRVATELLGEVGLEALRFGDWREPGSPLGPSREPLLGLPAGVPVVCGVADTQLAALGAGGVAPDAVTVVAGSSTPVQLAARAPLADPLRHPWVSTHALDGWWAAETNAGYPGTFSGWLSGLLGGAAPSGVPGANGVLALTAGPLWSEEAWTRKTPGTLLGLRPDTTAADLGQAAAEAHGYAVRGNVEDLERAAGRPLGPLLLTGGAADAQSIADITGRPVTVVPAAAAAGAYRLVTGTDAPAPRRELTPCDPGRYEQPYRRWRAAWDAVHAGLAEPEDACAPS